MKSIIKTHWRLAVLTILFSVSSSVTAIAVQFVKGWVLDAAINRQNELTYQAVILLVILIALEILFYYCNDVFHSKFTLETENILRQRYFNALLSRNHQEFSKKEDGEYIAQYTNQLDLIKENYFSRRLLLTGVLLKVVFAAIALFILDYRIAFLTVILLTTPIYVPNLIERKLRIAQERSVKAFDELLSKVTSWLKGFEIIKNYGIETRIAEKHKLSLDARYRKEFEKTILGHRAQMISTCLSYFAHFFILSLSAWLVLKGNFTAGRFFIAVGMIDQLSWPILALAAYYQSTISVTPVVNEIEQCLAYRTEEIKPHHVKKELIETVSYENVSFRRGEALIIENLNFVLRLPEKVLVLGPNGSGKSTSMNLLLNYFSPSDGQVSINGIGVQDLGNLGELITISRQDAVIFDESLRENLSLGSAISDDEILEVLNRVGLEKWANPVSLSMEIRREGGNLSGGEKRKINIARALLTTKPILILDEPYANLDKASIAKLDAALAAIDDRMLIVISHQMDEASSLTFDQILSFG